MRPRDRHTSDAAPIRVTALLGPRACVALALLCACGAPTEARRVVWPVATDASGVVPVRTDLGYDVVLTEARAAVQDFTFAIAGEVHAGSPWRRLPDLVLPVAHAHPGHFQGGDVTGELRGRFILDWRAGPGAQLGDATLLAGAYHSASFTFVRAGEADGLARGDPLFGHTALLRGRASRAGADVEFVALIDSPAGRELTGAPFDVEVAPGAPRRLGVRLMTRDDREGDTLFDGLDFAALDADGDGRLRLSSTSTPAAESAALDVLRRTFQTHDSFDVVATPPD